MKSFKDISIFPRICVATSVVPSNQVPRPNARPCDWKASLLADRVRRTERVILTPDNSYSLSGRGVPRRALARIPQPAFDPLR